MRDNYFQAQSIAVSGRLQAPLLDAQARFMQFLEKAGRLNRALEFLPSEEEIAERRAAKIGLTAPERAVLLAYSKIWLADELLASQLPEDEWIAGALGRYFPQTLREVYAGVMPRHPLRREIIATHVVNSMVNRVGATFVHRLMETTGAKPAEIVRAYLPTREVFAFVPLWQSIEVLDGKVPDAAQAEMLIEAGRLVVRATNWSLRSARLGAPMEPTIDHFRPGIEAIFPDYWIISSQGGLGQSVSQRLFRTAPDVTKKFRLERRVPVHGQSERATLPPLPGSSMTATPQP